jgi:uncharacterized protein
MNVVAIKTTTRGVSLALTITPRAGRDEVVGVAGDAIKIRLKAPPVEGRANEELLDFLAKRLAVPRAALAIISGASGRHKIVQVVGISADLVAQRLLSGE